LRERPHDRVNHLLVASERIGDEDTWEEVPEGAVVTLGEDFRLAVA
jgi:predicted glutamine amidotransferase